MDNIIIHNKLKWFIDYFSKNRLCCKIEVSIEPSELLLGVSEVIIYSISIRIKNYQSLTPHYYGLDAVAKTSKIARQDAKEGVIKHISSGILPYNVDKLLSASYYNKAYVMISRNMVRIGGDVYEIKYTEQ